MTSTITQNQTPTQTLTIALTTDQQSLCDSFDAYAAGVAAGAAASMNAAKNLVIQREVRKQQAEAFKSPQLSLGLQTPTPYVNGSLKEEPV